MRGETIAPHFRSSDNNYLQQKQIKSDTKIESYGLHMFLNKYFSYHRLLNKIHRFCYHLAIMVKTDWFQNDYIGNIK